MGLDSGGASLISALTSAQEREGWLSDASLERLARELGVPLHRLESLSTFYTYFRRTPPAGTSVYVCQDVSCALAGGDGELARLRERWADRDDVEICPVSCLGRCDRAPAAAVRETPATLEAEVLERLLEDPASVPTPEPARSWPAAELYRRPDDHYGCLRSWLGRDAATSIAELDAAGLRGMGGAGFPTGRKWATVAGTPAGPRYVICNADESEPATFKDRQILADLPHLVVEALALAARVVGAERGWIFIRHEYAAERQRLQQEISRARELGALGRGIFGSDFDFELEVFVSPGGYILGEETALLECMQDRRGEPRNKPPFPAHAGLWGRPTLINNPETLVHALAILHTGAEAWRARGVAGCAGQKFVSVSGDVERPGVLLVPMGTPLREILARCGGIRGGGRPAAVLTTASGEFLGAEHLDTPLDFDALAEAGSMLGTGGITFIAEGRDLAQVGLSLARFFARESCGKCVPCRVGSHKAVELVEREGFSSDTQGLLEELDVTLQQTSICGLGQVALRPLLSALRERAR